MSNTFLFRILLNSLMSSCLLTFQILCLHGFRQNKEIFKQKLGSFRKLLKPHAEFIFVDAPHLVERVNTEEPVAAEERSWWFTGEKTYVSKVPSDYDYGFDESIKYLQTVISEEGPFDGLLGFSQGATLAAILCSLCESGSFKANFKFAIIVAGFKSLCKPHSDFYKDTVHIPSLHVIGETDGVISKERSQELMAVFANTELLSHNGGHYVPASKEYKEIYVNFVKKYIL